MSSPVSSANRPSAAPPRGGRRPLFVIVLVVVLLVLFGVPWWTLVWSGTDWPVAVVVVGTVVFAVAFVAFPVAMFLGHSRRGLDWAARIGDTLLGIVWVLFVWSLIGDLLRLVLMAFGVENPLRGRVVAIVVVVVAALLLAWGYREATRLPRIKRVEVPIARLGPALDGLTVAVITDTHLGPIERSGWSAKVVAAVNALDADVVVHAGDIADGSVEKRRAQAAPLGTVRARLSKVYITGNHEYFGEVAQTWLDHMAELGWEPLHNRHVLVERGGDSLVVAGVDDATAEASRMPGHGANLAKALDGADPELPVVLAAHQPKQIAQAVEAGVDLQISGHTHGGQIWPFHYLVRADQPSVHGLTRHGARTQLYTSRGTGFWGPPFRIFAPSEITLLTLRTSNT